MVIGPRKKSTRSTGFPYVHYHRISQLFKPDVHIHNRRTTMPHDRQIRHFAIANSVLRKTGGTITATVPLDVLRRSNFPKSTLDNILSGTGHKADIVLGISEGLLVISVVDMPFRSFVKGLYDSLIKPAISSEQAEDWQLDRLSFAAASLRSRAFDDDVNDNEDTKATLLALESMLSGSIESLRTIRQRDQSVPELEQVAQETIRKVADAIAKWSERDPTRRPLAQLQGVQEVEPMHVPG